MVAGSTTWRGPAGFALPAHRVRDGLGLTLDPPVRYENPVGTDLCMANGRMFTIQGWGKVIKSEDHASRVVLADVGEFLIYGPGFLREKVLASSR